MAYLNVGEKPLNKKNNVFRTAAMAKVISGLLNTSEAIIIRWKTMEDFFNKQFSESRRNFLRKSSLGFGSIALSSMLSPSLGVAKNFSSPNIFSTNGLPHFIPKAKRVIYLFQI